MTKITNQARIEVFRSGEFKPMVGAAISYSADDLENIVTHYDADQSPAPIVVGHPTTDAPAFGWVSNFEYDRDADRLYADVDDIEPAFAQAVKDGRYKNVSMSFFKPDASNNPAPGNWYPKHIGFLGAAAPAVSGLKPIQFANIGDDEILTFVASFGEPGFQDAAGLFRNLREFLIEKFSMEEADKVLPSWKLEWLDETEITPKSDPEPYLFVEPPEELPEDVSMTPEELTALQKREKTVATREAAITERELSARNDAHTSFAEGLVAQGKLLPASKAGVVALLNALPADQHVSFAEGENEPLNDALMKILGDQPVSIEFSATDMSDDLDGNSISFASDGKPVDRDQIALDAKARAHMNQHPGIDYITAVEAVS